MIPSFEHIEYLLQHKHDRLDEQEINALSDFVGLLKKSLRAEIENEYITLEEKRKTEEFIEEIKAIIKENQTALKWVKKKK